MNKALLHQLLRMRSYIGSDSFRRYLYANEDGMSHGEFFDAVAAAIAQQEPQTKPVVDQNQANVIDKALLQRSLAMIQSGTYPLTQAASREFLIDDLIAAMAQCDHIVSQITNRNKYDGVLVGSKCIEVWKAKS